MYRIMVRRDGPGADPRLRRTLYAPVALVSLPLVWMLLIVVAFSFIFWGTGSLTWQKAFEISGSSLTTLGFSEPAGTSRIASRSSRRRSASASWPSSSATCRRSTAYNSREKGIIRLRPLAGAPPSVPSSSRPCIARGARGEEFWRNQTDWILDIEQTHTAFPILTYFPETHANHSWVATLGTLLDAAALVRVGSGTDATESWDAEKGPLMVLVFGIPAVVRMARAANVPLEPAPSLLELTAHFAEPAPRSASRADEYLDAAHGVRPSSHCPPRATPREPGAASPGCARATTGPLRALAGLTQAPPAPWTTDRPPGSAGPGSCGAAHPGGLVSPPRPSPPAPAGTAYRWLKPPDSSLVIETDDRVPVEVGDASSMSSSRSVARSRLTPWRTRIRWTETSETEPVSG